MFIWLNKCPVSFIDLQSFTDFYGEICIVGFEMLIANKPWTIGLRSVEYNFTFE